MTPTAALEAGASALAAKAAMDLAAAGDSWATPAADGDVWFVANPNENEDKRSSFELPAIASADDVMIGGELARHTFAMVDGREALSLLVYNYRTDSDRLWDENISEEALAAVPLDEVGDAAPGSTTLTFDYPTGTDRPTVNAGGADVVEKWDASSARLALTFSHRGLVEITIS